MASIFTLVHAEISFPKYLNREKKKERPEGEAMSAANVDPHDKMRARDVNRVVRGEQAPRPAHEYGTVSRAPPFPSPSHPSNNNNNRESDHTKEDSEVELKTTPNDSRFPFMNQTHHCYARYLEYHKCIQEKGEDAPECEKFADCYKSLCPDEWIRAWNEQRTNGTFPGPI